MMPIGVDTAGEPLIAERSFFPRYIPMTEKGVLTRESAMSFVT